MSGAESVEYDTGYTERNERLYRCRACWYRTADPVDILEHLAVEHDPHAGDIAAAAALDHADRIHRS